MAGYIEETLTKGETVLLTGKITLRKYWLNFLLAFPYGLVGIGTLAIHTDAKPLIFEFVMMLVVVVALLVVPIVRYFTNEIAVTNKRVIAKFGVLSLQAVEIKLDKVESVIVRQGLFGQLLSYGTVVVTGSGGTHAVMQAISEPTLFKRAINSTIEETLGAQVNQAV